MSREGCKENTQSKNVALELLEEVRISSGIPGCFEMVKKALTGRQ